MPCACMTAVYTNQAINNSNNHHILASHMYTNQAINDHHILASHMYTNQAINNSNNHHILASHMYTNQAINNSNNHHILASHMYTNQAINNHHILTSHIFISGMRSQLYIDLMEKVEAEIPAKWEEVGYALGITRPSMQRNPMTEYREMFTHWQNKERN